MKTSRAPTWGYGGLIFLVAFGLRWAFHQGFFLGDNPFEWWIMKSVLAKGPDYHQQSHLRFALWLLNVLVERCFGVSPTTFFLPNEFCSASLGVIAYAILRRRGFKISSAFCSGLLVGTSPFEIMLGTTWNNDVFLEWYLAVCLLVLVWDDRDSLWRGILTAALFWLAFYVKLWAVYFLPTILMVLGAGLRRRQWSMTLGFFGASLILHSLTCLYWNYHTGFFLPFIHYLPDTYPVVPGTWAGLFLAYPKILFQGSDLHTTLFGWVPYLCIVTAAVKGYAAWRFPRRFRWDGLDAVLTVEITTFFLLLNFFPNNFRLDHYYSVFRIYRYLAPLSFPMTLAAFKNTLDLYLGLSLPNRFRPLSSVLMGLALSLNLLQAAQATEPGRRFHRATLAVLQDLRELRPPRLIGENWVLYLFEQPYRDQLSKTMMFSDVTAEPHHPNDAASYERWIAANETHWEHGTVLLTGLASYPNYGCQGCGPRLSFFKRPLSGRWTLYKELPDRDPMRGEPIDLWVLNPTANPAGH